MTPKGFVLSDPAVGDLRAIRNHLVGSNPAAVRHVLDDIRSAIERLVQFPDLGHPRDDLADQQLRVWPVHAYLVIYRPDKAPLQVVRILHGYRNLTTILG